MNYERHVMTKIHHGNRIGREAKISVGSSAVIFNPDRKKLLLTRRADNGQWCLPSGRLDPGESITECCIREVLEETGLTVEVVRLIGVYSSPHEIVEYPDGNKVQIVSVCFEARIVSGELAVSDETLEFEYFDLKDTETIDLIPNHRQRILDAFSSQKEPFIR